MIIEHSSYFLFFYEPHFWTEDRYSGRHPIIYHSWCIHFPTIFMVILDFVSVTNGSCIIYAEDSVIRSHSSPSTTSASVVVIVLSVLSCLLVITTIILLVLLIKSRSQYQRKIASTQPASSTISGPVSYDAVRSIRTWTPLETDHTHVCGWIKSTTAGL